VASVLAAWPALHSAVPYWDQFGEPTPAEIRASLLLHHNEHLILLPRLGFLLDHGWVSGRNTVNLATILGIQLLHALLLAWVAGTAAGRRFDLLAFGLALAALFSAYSFENLFWGFQTQFVGVFLLGSAACAALFLRPGPAGLPGAVLAGGAASLTLANGVLLLPLLAAVALLAGRPRREVLWLGLAGALALAAFLSGYRPVAGHGTLSTLWRDPGGVLVFLAALLGAPPAILLGLGAPRDGAAGPAALLGAAGLAAVALLAALRLRRGAAPAEWALFAILAFVVASATTMAAGRVVFGMHAAAAPRYGTPALLFWLVLLLWAQAALAGRPLRVRLAVASLAVATVAVLAGHQARFLRMAEGWLGWRHAVETAWLAGVRDVAAFGRIHPEAERVAAVGARLRAERRSVFSDPWAGWLDQPLDAVARLAPAGRCRGGVDVVAAEPGAGFLRLRGWAADAGGRPLFRVVIADAAGRVVGFGRGPIRRPAEARAAAGPRQGWQGHARGEAAEGLMLFGVLAPGELCALGPAG
jgi:hypothetical protein